MKSGSLFIFVFLPLDMMGSVTLFSCYVFEHMNYHSKVPQNFDWLMALQNFKGAGAYMVTTL